MKFSVLKYHTVIADAIDKVFSGEIKRLIINIPPGYSKTELAVVSFVARGLAINPRARFIHTSFSDRLVQENSMKIKDLILSPEYQELWPITMRKDKQSKSLWETEDGGMLLAAPTGGTILGFRAGRMEPGFSGAVLIDDPLKADDAYSKVKRDRVIERLVSTVSSRIIHDDIPIVVIMQRLHEEDPAGFFLTGGSGEKWHHLLLPAEIQEDFKYPEEYKFGIPIEHNLDPGMLWEGKHTKSMMERMRKNSPLYASSQYDQSPSPKGGAMFKDEWWQSYKMEPEFDYRFITADTAQKTKEINDRSVFGCFGVKGNRLYVLDIVKGKWESPDLKVVFKDFVNKHRHASATYGRLREIHIEDKASGTDLIQSLRREIDVPIFDIQRHIDKVTRAHDTVPYVASERVYLPEDSEWASDFKSEMRKFTELMTHKYDDQVDMFMDGVEIGMMDNKKEAGAF